MQALQAPETSAGSEVIARSAMEIQDWLTARIATRLEVSPQGIDLDEPLIDVGLDSMEFVALVGELEQWLGCRFRDNPLIDYPTISALSTFLADELAAGRTDILPTRPAVERAGV
ncbi:Phthiocerol/phenolphthiocerol synthesis polyketide synthase type I PpsA [Caulifigura coniformis]|uniref:Phthiocerol/phenolphthiocerol synthesis polyketide synthase type I PpsA n=1 Tax=Caulifigura coniformis TaxID=2527983 RepID=A0A517S889_9PLAN|nr:acyl carrier protein [Caulifigura coniformis]QDT52346.1 Phthiocerol/phenolphthiocerol synthesis polyketide synthase type I PpsA [Caulifigura coniformis]